MITVTITQKAGYNLTAGAAKSTLSAGISAGAVAASNTAHKYPSFRVGTAVIGAARIK